MDDLLERLTRFEKGSFPRFGAVYRQLVAGAALLLRGWHSVLEEGQVLVFDAASGRFLPSRQLSHLVDTASAARTRVDADAWSTLQTAVKG